MCFAVGKAQILHLCLTLSLIGCTQTKQNQTTNLQISDVLRQAYERDRKCLATHGPSRCMVSQENGWTNT